MTGHSRDSGSALPLRLQLVGLASWLVLVLMAAVIGGLGSASAATFYAELRQPAWAPPAWLFGPAWTVLYTLMAIAAWLVWRRQGPGGARMALVLFGTQLAFNALWSWLFFEWRMGAVAFVEILVLWLLIGLTIAAFAQISRLAALLLVPYFLWVSYAAALSFDLWQRNPELLG